MKPNLFFCTLGLMSLGLLSHSTAAESDSNKIVIDMVPNTTTSTATPSFYISQHAITPEQYCAFLNAVDTTESRFYHKEWGDMMRTNWDLLTIARSNITPPFKYIVCNYETYRITTQRNPTNFLDQAITNIIPERPIMKGIPMDDAARFCNWLANNQPVGDIGDGTTESGSYTIFENRTRQPGDSLLLQSAIYDPRFPGGTELKNSYMSVTRNAGAAWRLPTRANLAMLFSPQSWGFLDDDIKLWYWTEDSYLMDRPQSTWDPYHVGLPCNTFGYYRVKNGGVAASRIDLPHAFQTSFLPDTGFFVAFSADTMPTSGFRILNVANVSQIDPSSNSTTPSQPLLPPAVPPAVTLPPTITP